MAPTTIPNPLVQPTLGVEEAGRLCGLGRQAAYSAARAGHLPTVRLGKKLRVPTAALLRLLQLDGESVEGSDDTSAA
jgi:excisionase family DNA binding protein